MSYSGYFALADYFHVKEKAFIKAKEEREGRRALLRKQRLEEEVAAGW